jgi:hypothetical protein
MKWRFEPIIFLDIKGVEVVQSSNWIYEWSKSRQNNNEDKIHERWRVVEEWLFYELMTTVGNIIQLNNDLTWRPIKIIWILVSTQDKIFIFGRYPSSSQFYNLIIFTTLSSPDKIITKYQTDI